MSTAKREPAGVGTQLSALAFGGFIQVHLLQQQPKNGLEQDLH
jgi:hypothetical protein